MPSTGGYLVSPRSIALIAACLMLSGVSKSGSPTESEITSRPLALRSRAFCVIAMVADGLTRERTLARKATGMAPFFCRRNERRTYSEANAARQPWNQDGGGTGREESPATGSAHKFTRANDSKALAALLRNFLAATSVSLISRGETKRF